MKEHRKDDICEYATAGYLPEKDVANCLKSPYKKSISFPNQPSQNTKIENASPFLVPTSDEDSFDAGMGLGARV